MDGEVGGTQSARALVPGLWICSCKQAILLFTVAVLAPADCGRIEQASLLTGSACVCWGLRRRRALLCSRREAGRHPPFQFLTVHAHPPLDRRIAFVPHTPPGNGSGRPQAHQCAQQRRQQSMSRSRSRRRSQTAAPAETALQQQQRQGIASTRRAQVSPRLVCAAARQCREPNRAAPAPSPEPAGGIAAVYAACSTGAAARKGGRWRRDAPPGGAASAGRSRGQTRMYPIRWKIRGMDSDAPERRNIFMGARAYTRRAAASADGLRPTLARRQGLLLASEEADSEGEVAVGFRGG